MQAEKARGWLRGWVALVLMAALFSSGAAWAELANWNQERVTGYAKELVDACEGLAVAVNQLPIQQAKQRVFYQARDDIRIMERAAKGLAAALESGEDRAATEARFKRIQLLRRDAEVNARGADFPEGVFDKIFPVGGALLKLRPYYEEDPEAAEREFRTLLEEAEGP